MIVGCPRSGTTLLRLMLDAHPELAIPPEWYFWAGLSNRIAKGVDRSPNADQEFKAAMEEAKVPVPNSLPNDWGDAVRAVYANYASSKGKPRCGDKTTVNWMFSGFVLGLLPETRVIHLVRDGRDVALSMKRISAWKDKSLDQLIEQWSLRVIPIRHQMKKHPHYMEVDYRDLVLEPETTLRRVCEFVALDFDPVMLEYVNGAAQKIDELSEKNELSAEEVGSMHSLLASLPDSRRVDVWKQEAPELWHPTLSQFGFSTDGSRHAI